MYIVGTVFATDYQEKKNILKKNPSIFSKCTISSPRAVLYSYFDLEFSNVEELFSSSYRFTYLSSLFSARNFYHTITVSLTYFIYTA